MHRKRNYRNVLISQEEQRERLTTRTNSIHRARRGLNANWITVDSSWNAVNPFCENVIHRFRDICNENRTPTLCGEIVEKNVRRSIEFSSFLHFSYLLLLSFLLFVILFSLDDRSNLFIVLSFRLFSCTR